MAGTQCSPYTHFLPLIFYHSEIMWIPEYLHLSFQCYHWLRLLLACHDCLLLSISLCVCVTHVAEAVSLSNMSPGKLTCQTEKGTTSFCYHNFSSNLPHYFVMETQNCKERNRIRREVCRKKSRYARGQNREVLVLLTGAYWPTLSTGLMTLRQTKPYSNRVANSHDSASVSRSCILPQCHAKSSTK